MISYKKSKTILEDSKINLGSEIISTNDCVNRVVSTNIKVNVNYPSGNNAAFDGYAIRSNDTTKLKKKFFKKFKIIGSIAAGDKPFKKVNKFETVEIMTGALIPKEFDAIIPIEGIKFYPSKDKPVHIMINNKIPKLNIQDLKDQILKRGNY